MIADQLLCPAPDTVEMKGLLGKRFTLSRLNRLRHQEEEHLLWPFQEGCPVGWIVDGRSHPEIRGDWQGEFIGTWLNAAVLSAWNTTDTQLKQKIDLLVKDWLDTQKEDGYLGTYAEADRWKSWDVWIQAHDLIGLLTYYRYTRARKILTSALRIAERVMQDFGPSKLRITQTGPHGGMASSAILEPLMWLYWETGDERYLGFGRWLVDEDWEAENGPKIISSLLAGRGVAGIANGKGCEMLICFAGLLELYRATGEPRYLQAVLNGWDDIVQHHLYITGSASTGEYFQPDFALRNDGVYRLGETCVSMSWIYINLSLGRLTGEARFFDMAEQTLYNHLLGAQSPDGKGWAYYVGLRDSKRYRWHTDPDCCPTRGVRALAQMPQYVFSLSTNGVYVNFYESCTASLKIADSEATIGLFGNYPFSGEIELRLFPNNPVEFSLFLRLPGWCQQWSLKVNGEIQSVTPSAQGYLAVHKVWSPGDIVNLSLDMPVCTVVDQLGNRGKVTLVRGPLVYAADSSYLSQGQLLDDLILKIDHKLSEKGVHLLTDELTGMVHLLAPTTVEKPAVGAGWWREKERYYGFSGKVSRKSGEMVELVPFFEAGNHDPENYHTGIWPHDEPARKITYQVWLSVGSY